MNSLALISRPIAHPSLIVAAGDRASRRCLEFFAANIRNPHTRRAYGRAVAEFLAWCDDNDVPSIEAVQPLHVAAWIEMQQQEFSAPTVKQHLAALRHLFDWLVTGQVIPTNLASSVRGPSHAVKIGKTPVLEPEDGPPRGIPLDREARCHIMVYARAWSARHKQPGQHRGMGSDGRARPMESDGRARLMVSDGRARLMVSDGRARPMESDGRARPMESDLCLSC